MTSAGGSAGCLTAASPAATASALGVGLGLGGRVGGGLGRRLGLRGSVGGEVADDDLRGRGRGDVGHVRRGGHRRRGRRRRVERLGVAAALELLGHGGTDAADQRDRAGDLQRGALDRAGERRDVGLLRRLASLLGRLARLLGGLLGLLLADRDGLRGPLAQSPLRPGLRKRRTASSA